MSDRWFSALTDQGARFADGRVAHYGDLSAELAAARLGTVFCDLSHQGIILVAGEDAGKFLHAQFCNDVLALAEGSAQWNGWCSAKGRLLATFLLWKGRQGYFLQLPRALQAAIQKRLQMFVLRAKVTLTDESANWVRIGIAGRDADAQLRQIFGQAPAAAMTTVHVDAGRLIRLSDTRFEFVGDTEHALAAWTALAALGRKVGAPVWDGLAIREGVPTVLPQTQEAFVPQMANFELAGGVSFRKGCYPGQEIVARTQYRGILKRRMVRVHGAVDALGAAPQPGDPVYAAEFGEQAAGMFANVAPSADGGYDALVVAQLDAIRADSLRVGSPAGHVLSVLPLPYAIPELV